MIDTHGMRVDFGKYGPKSGQPGELYTRVPVSYLRWMVNDRHHRAEIAKSELERRGIPLVNSPIDISGHAIDSASLRVLKLWRGTRSSSKVGLHAWLIENVVEALSHGEPNGDGQISHNGMILVLARGELWWTLKTVMRETG